MVINHHSTLHMASRPPTSSHLQRHNNVLRKTLLITLKKMQTIFQGHHFENGPPHCLRYDIRPTISWWDCLGLDFNQDDISPPVTGEWTIMAPGIFDVTPGRYLPYPSSASSPRWQPYVCHTDERIHHFDDVHNFDQPGLVVIYDEPRFVMFINLSSSIFVIWSNVFQCWKEYLKLHHWMKSLSKILSWLYFYIFLALIWYFTWKTIKLVTAATLKESRGLRGDSVVNAVCVRDLDVRIVLDRPLCKNMLSIILFFFWSTYF
jgi:hypothetical protein